MVDGVLGGVLGGVLVGVLGGVLVGVLGDVLVNPAAFLLVLSLGVLFLAYPSGVGGCEGGIGCGFRNDRDLGLSRT